MDVKNPYTRPQQELIISESAAFQVDPVTGIGLILSPDGTPIFLKLRPSTASAAWVGSAIGDEWSTAFILPTKWGHVGMLQSRVWGHFRFIPDGTGKVRILSCNFGEVGICGNGTEWEPPFPDIKRAGAMGGLAGTDGNCWVDTEDMTLTGASFWLGDDADDPVGQSFEIQSSTGTCAGSPVQVADSPDIPDWSVRDYFCTGFPVFDRIVDILFGYSADALEALGDSEAAMFALANIEIAMLNETFENSRMRVRARLVGVELGMVDTNGDGIENAPYVGSGSPPQDRNVLVMEYLPGTQGLRGLFEELRDSRGADIVTLLVANNVTGVAGIAMDIPTQEGGAITGENAILAGAVYTLESALSGTYQHEVGHLLGGCHGSPNAEIEGAGEATCPCRTPETDDCLLLPMVEPNAFPDEFHYGYRFFVEYDEVPPTEDEMMHTIMAYPPEDGESERVLYFSNPNVQVLGTSSDTGTIDDDLRCCVDDAENCANAWVMDYFVSGVAADSFPGIAQYRCRTIPYDCNQNGAIDTEEFDGVHPWGNPDGLTDIDGDRVADGCLPRLCLGLADSTQPALVGSGGSISDFSVMESVVEVATDEDDDSWAFQPLEITIEGLVHPDVTQLDIALVHRHPDGSQDTFTLSNCGGSLGPDAATVLSGTYRFVTPTDPNSFNTLVTPTICQTAEAGGVGGAFIPAGNYRPQAPMTSSEWADHLSNPPKRRSEAGSWILRIADNGIGGTGFFSGWSLLLAYVPYAGDCDGDGLPDGCLTDFTLGTDCNQNGNLDQCEISADPKLDCNLSGVLDECEDLTHLLDCGGLIWDADGNGTVDIADSTYLDVNCPDWPLEGNCRPDLCDILDFPGLDANFNYMIDSCEPDGGGGGIGCSSRPFDSSTSGLTGPGVSSSDLGVVRSTINVPVTADDGATAVLNGALVMGQVTVVLTNFEHDNIDNLEIRLKHTAAGYTVTVPLLSANCSGTGYPQAPNSHTFLDGGSMTFCDRAVQGGIIPDTVSYRPEGAFSAFISMPAAGNWTIEVYDIYLGENGGFDSWDLSFIHRPPDADNNGIPDVCEDP